MITLNTIALILVMAASSSSATPVRYVTDELEFFTRSGPTTAYRIIGSVKSGEPVTVLASSEDDSFTQIETADGKIFWIESKFLSRQPAAKDQLATLQEALKQSQKQQEQAQAQSLSQTEKAAALSARVDALTEELLTSENEKEILEQNATSAKKRFQLDVFLAGGAVALGGMLLGFIFSKFGGKKRRDLF